MIITDSLGAPRKVSTVLPYKKTWPCLLSEYMEQNFNYNNFVYTKQGLYAKTLREYVDMKLDLYDTGYVFLQMGIVDCARRVLSEKAFRTISMFPGIRDIVRFFAKKYHIKLTKLYKVVYTNEKDFKKSIEYFISKFNSSRIYIIPILPVGDKHRAVSYGIDYQVKKYNEIYKQIAQNNSHIYFMESIIHKMTPVNNNMYMNDGYHINENAHQIIYEELVNNLKNN